MNTIKKYMILLVDRQKAKIFTISDGIVGQKEEFVNHEVPQRVHANNIHFYGRSDKIARHIEEHLHRHLLLVAQKAAQFAKQNHISGLIIGGHKPLFKKIEKHLLYPLNKKVKGKFVTELKTPFNNILKKVRQYILNLENHEEVMRYEAYLEKH